MVDKELLVQQRVSKKEIVSVTKERSRSNS